MLEARGISVSFGGVRAVSNVSFTLGEELIGLVGPNGSGKTTLVNALCGVVPATGSLTVGGRAVPLQRPRATWKAGIARVFQAPQTFTALTCIENVLLGSRDERARGAVGAWLARPRMVAAERRRWTAACAALDFVGLGAFADTSAANLTYGQQRLLELARAINGDPQVLLLDEPSAGLNDAETAELGSMLRRIRGDGTPILVIDHKVDFLDSLCDRLLVLELGVLIADGAPADVWADQRVIDAYLGRAVDA